MRIFADHCVPTDVLKVLQEIGIKVERAIDKKLEKASDKEVFNYILKTSQTLLTFDKDFGNIIRFNIKNSKGVVIIYSERMSKTLVIERTVGFFQKIKERELKGSLFIVGLEEVRIWRG